MRDISYILSPTPEVPFTVVGGYLYGTNIYHTMSRIFHFGDSYAGTGMIDKHFVHHISKKINYTRGIQENICDYVIPQLIS